MHQTLTEKILDNEGDIKGDNIWVSISFTDISSYSTIIEHMSPEKAVKLLNEYFDIMVEAISEQGGMVDKFIGDGIMALFPNSAVDAVNSAVKMQHRVMEFNKKNMFRQLIFLSLS